MKQPTITEAEARRGADEQVTLWRKGGAAAQFASAMYQPEVLGEIFDHWKAPWAVHKPAYIDEVLCELAALHLEHSQLPEPVRKCAAKVLREAIKKNTRRNDQARRNITIISILLWLKECSFPLFPNRAGRRPRADLRLRYCGRVTWKNRHRHIRIDRRAGMETLACHHSGT